MENDVQVQKPEQLLITLGEQFQKRLNILRSAYGHRYIIDWPHCIYRFIEHYRERRDHLIKMHNIDIFRISKSASNYFDLDALIAPEQYLKAGKARKKVFELDWIDNLKTVLPYLEQSDARYNLYLINKNLPHDYERKQRLAYKKNDIEELASIVREPEFLEYMLKGKKTLKEAFLNNPRSATILKEIPDIEVLVESFSEALDYTLINHKHGNPIIGEQSKDRSNDFAKSMNESLKNVRQEGFKSTRKIADRFNELGIKSSRGGEWSHNTVSRLIVKRRELGLEDQEGNELTAG